MKLFRTSSANTVQDCRKFFLLLPISNLIDLRIAAFLKTLLQIKIKMLSYRRETTLQRAL